MPRNKSITPKKTNPNSLNNLKCGEDRYQLTKEDKSKGGKKSQEVQHRKKELKACLLALLEQEMTSKSGDVLSGAEAISAKLFEQALKGNIKAFETIRDTAGQKPSEKVEVSTGDINIQKEIEDIINNMKIE